MLLLACASTDSTAEVDRAESGLSETDGPPAAALLFRWPLADEAAFNALVGVDHDPVVQEEGIDEVICTDYLGRMFPHCYDEHDGSDYILDGGFDAMDAGSQPILAARDGVVIEAHDGEYDRCHAGVDGIDCDGNSGVANYVVLEHEDGWQSRYWHMMKDSVAVEVGQRVACGDQLGVVGSSGYSSGPHLHFELNDAAGEAWDPYAGPYSQEERFWTEQLEDPAFPGMDCP